MDYVLINIIPFFLLLLDIVLIIIHMFLKHNDQMVILFNDDVYDVVSKLKQIINQ